MARRREAGTLKLIFMSIVLIGGLALPAQAQELNLGASTAFTTDYMFRGISQTDENPAVQASLDVTYGIFYLGIWGSNVDFGGGPAGQDIANLEIDYYAGIAPTWQGISFDIGGLYYTFPGAHDPDGEFNYFELATAASYTFFEVLTLGVANYWAPENFGQTGDGDAFELAGEYAFPNTWWIFSPSISALVGWQWVEGDGDYTYWNAGLTLGFMDNWAADIRYWDTDISYAGCGFADICDGRVVGTLSTSF